MKTKNSVVWTLLIAVVIAVCVMSVAGNDKKAAPGRPYALIFGTIYGADNHPAPGVKIKIRREGDKKSIDLVSDNRGEFAHRFPAGKADYVVWADLKDRQAAQKTEVKVHVENDERQDLTLHLSASK